ncbi:hypothetical protein NVP1127O_49 [Vibrio phage 1.127.O._10N.286.52.E12]|nr:hypothetical protein NVP1127O_49 [Vibrio phage 1.127.O._10N.286.52.E12]
MAKCRFTRNYHDHHKGEVVEGMQFDSKTVMVRTPYNTGSVITFEPMFLGSQKLLVKLK